MTTAVRELLDSFDALSDTEKHEAYAYLLQRMLQASSGDVPEAALIAAAEELFLDLDAAEARDPQP
jgi:hypothetical protein